jgi:protein TonB
MAADKPDKPQSKGDEAQKAGAGAAESTMLSSEIFLHAEDEQGGLKRNFGFVLVAIILHAVVFMITFPEIKYEVKDVERERKTMVVRKYTPPPPPQKQQKQIKRKDIKKMPVPDPTPDEPEPIIEPEPEPEPEPVDPDMDIVLGDPEPPPQTAPLMAGVGGVTEPERIAETYVKPEYPELARRARVEGRVILQVVIRKDGTVGEMEVIQAPAADLGFGDAAKNAVSQWRYRPARQNNRPVDVFMTVVVNFSLD